MAQSGFTPITLYYSSTAAAAPTSGNLANGELALNITDGKLYYKDNAGAVQLLANKTNAVSPLPVLNGGTGTTTSTGTGNTVLSASPTFTGTLAAAAITASTTLGVTGVSTLTGGAVVQGLTVGLGANAVAQNTVLGYQAFATNTGGSLNVAIGYSALNKNLSGVENTATGAFTLYKTTGSYNTATGSQALYDNTSGAYNTATGTRALIKNVSGSNNTATGQRALNNNLISDDNTAHGASALYTNTGTANTATGSSALYLNNAGSYNTANGYQALLNNDSGSGNTAINPMSNAGAYAPVFDPTTQNNRFCMGSTAVTNAYIQVAWTVVSDARDKTNFGVIPHGLAFVNKLTPVSFQFKESRAVDVPHGPVRYGFRAQDILALEGASSVVIDAEDPEKLRFNESSLVPILVKAIQELTARVAALEAR